VVLFVGYLCIYVLCCCVIYSHSKFIWSKLLGYATYYVVSLIRLVSSVVCESGG
jgi:hypothetical protein